MKLKFLKNYNRIIVSVLSVLGLGSTSTFWGCDNIFTVEYGSPHADFKVSGTITNQANKKVPGVKVVLRYDSAYTNIKGKYNVQIEDFPTDQTFEIQFIDVDDETNGELQSLDTTVIFKNPEFRNGDGNWYSGETSKEFNIKLKDKN